MTRQFDWLLADYHDTERAPEGFTHVTAPRRSCLEAGAPRLRLSRLLINDMAIIGGYLVRRVGTDKGRVKGYRIGEFKLTYAEVLAIVEGRAALPVKHSLPLEDLPMFKKSEAA